MIVDDIPDPSQVSDKLTKLFIYRPSDTRRIDWNYMHFFFIVTFGSLFICLFIIVVIET